MQRGARLVESDYGSARRVTDAAFLNPDGTLAVVVVNQTRREQSFALSLPQGSIQDSSYLSVVGSGRAATTGQVG